MSNITKKIKKTYKYYEIKVAIKGTHPPVWRKLQIPEGLNFHQLSQIIQIAFDWSGSHLYSFEDEIQTRIEIPSEDGDDDGYIVKDSRKVKIDKYLEQGVNFTYIYDFGDWWEHSILLEKIVKTDKPLKCPICTKAKMASLPEDCGGVYGYEELLKTLSDKNNPEYKEMKKWLEEGFNDFDEDRTKVEIDVINMQLEEYEECSKNLLEDFI